MVKIARILFVFFTVMMVLSSCDNGKSYADLLKEEDKAVKAFLADKIVINSIPADSVFVTLQDVGNNDTLAVPYYRLDDAMYICRFLMPGYKTIVLRRGMM